MSDVAVHLSLVNGWSKPYAHIRLFLSTCTDMCFGGAIREMRPVAGARASAWVPPNLEKLGFPLCPLGFGVACAQYVVPGQGLAVTLNRRSRGQLQRDIMKIGCN